MTWEDLASILALVAVPLLAFSALLLWFTSRRASAYQADAHRATLEMLRAATESRIYDLTQRLVSSEERWKDVNHLLLDSQSYQVKGSSNSAVRQSTFLRNAGISGGELAGDPRLAFVLIPFNEEFADTFSAIKTACEQAGLRAMRGDEEQVNTDIMRHILRLIARARVVIAVVDGRNPNVFYELGIAHAMNKTTILVSSQGSFDLPFDIAQRRVVIAESPDQLAQKLAPALSQAILASEEDTDR